MASHMKVSIGDRVRYNGHVPYSDVDSLQHRSWLVWRLLWNHAAGSPHVYRDVDGLRWKGKLSSLIWHLFPEMAQLSDTARESFQRKIREYLHATGNAVCLQHTKGHVVWWARGEWSMSESTVANFDGQVQIAVNDERQPHSDPVNAEHVSSPVTLTYAPPYYGVDPRWFSELVRAIQTSLSNGLFGQVVADLATRTDRFVPADVSSSIGVPAKNGINNVLNSLKNANVATLLKPVQARGRNGVVSSTWAVLDWQRVALTKVLEFIDDGANYSNTADGVQWYEPTGAADVLESLSDTEWYDIDQITVRTYAVRTRLYGILHRLEGEGHVERGASLGSTSRWRRAHRQIELSSAPVVTVVSTSDSRTEQVRTVNVDDQLVTVAHLLDEIVKTRVDEATTELQRKYDQVVRERDELRVALAPLRELLKS